MSQNTIAFIGGGNMATSLVGGLIANGVAADAIWVSDTVEEKLAALQEKFQIRTTTDNAVAVTRAETVVLAVKPQSMREMAQGLAAAAAEHRPLFVSVAAGVRQGDIGRWLGYEAAIVRAMPNTPALVGSGATALYANPSVSAEERSRAESILRAVGVTLWVEDEDALDAVTALSGSGPAYYFLLMELMEEAGHALGLPREAARMLTLQTAYGAARMALESDDAPAVLRARVTSPGGTTERALHTLREGGLDALVARALESARTRSIELGEEFGRD
jgi:pyrroline-5-carboxylate reductase